MAENTILDDATLLGQPTDPSPPPEEETEVVSPASKKNYAIMMAVAEQSQISYNDKVVVTQKFADYVSRCGNTCRTRKEYARMTASFWTLEVGLDAMQSMSVHLALSPQTDA